MIPMIPGVDCFEIVLFIVEWMKYLVAVNVVVFFMVKSKWRPFVATVLPLILAILTLGITLGSWEDAAAKGYDPNLPSLRDALENYIETGSGNVDYIIESGKYAPTIGSFEIKYLLTDLMTHTLLHLDSHNGMNIPIAYNKGNDWFRATLGEPMVYTSGVYKNGDESLMEAQNHKLDFVADSIQLEEGEKVLDIGCGWGRLAKFFTDNYKAKVTGVTLSAEQKKYADDLNKGNGAKIELQDAMKLHERKDLVPKGGFDKITCLEMAEHVGIARYDEFLSSVHNLLKEDGILYFQVAGLRREWQYEDIVWGLFMGEHIFPGADASTPMGWVTNHLERNGFEVQRVHNLGTHYSRTLAQWLEEWRLYKPSIVEKYGDVAWRRWEVFLAWSVRIARQGSSTVFMITATKHGNEKMRISAQSHFAP